MNLLDRLLGKRPYPTANWGQFHLPIPDFDFTDMRFGTLRLGDPFKAAAFLGRPDRCEWTQREYCELIYAAGGFQMDFTKGALSYLAFFIGPDELLPKHEGLAFSQPRLRGCAPDSVQLSSNFDRAALERVFGVAESVDADSDEVILFYTRHNVTMESELDGRTGGLKRWNLYPK